MIQTEALSLLKCMRGFVSPSIVAAALGVSVGHLRRVALKSPFPGQRRTPGGQLRFVNCRGLRASILNYHTGKVLKADKAHVKRRRVRKFKHEFDQMQRADRYGINSLRAANFFARREFRGGKLQSYTDTECRAIVAECSDLLRFLERVRERATVSP